MYCKIVEMKSDKREILVKYWFYLCKSDRGDSVEWTRQALRWPCWKPTDQSNFLWFPSVFEVLNWTVHDLLFQTQDFSRWMGFNTPMIMYTVDFHVFNKLIMKHELMIIGADSCLHEVMARYIRWIATCFKIKVNLRMEQFLKPSSFRTICATYITALSGFQKNIAG